MLIYHPLEDDEVFDITIVYIVYFLYGLAFICTEGETVGAAALGCCERLGTSLL